MHPISIHTETPSFLIITEGDDTFNRIGKSVAAPIVWTAASSMHFVHVLVMCLFASFVKTYHFFTPKKHSDHFHDLYLDSILVCAHFAVESFLKSVNSIFINFRSAHSRKYVYVKIEKAIEKIYHSSVLDKVRRIHIDGTKPTSQLNLTGILKVALLKTGESLSLFCSSFSFYANKVVEDIHIR